MTKVLKGSTFGVMNVSMAQASGHDLAACLCLRVSHRLAGKVSIRDVQARNLILEGKAVARQLILCIYKS